MATNYYISSFFWSTLSKILTAIVGFISIPLLLGYYGKAEYGILSIATACNGYMHLLDLGMNIGAVKFFSQWRAKGDIGKVYRVARTNITFYFIISAVNIVCLLVLAIWGERLFAISHEQFLQLRLCLFVLALFCTLSWGATTFNQLLIADKQMAFTMQVQCAITLLKVLAIISVFIADFALTTYFFYLTAIVALAFFPYAYKCKKDGLIDTLKPAWYWQEFKIVLKFSLSIFCLSIFQVTATQSRPILLSMFASDGAMAVADFRIVEVFPQFIIMLCGTFSGIFLPKTSEMVANNDETAIHTFAYKWTAYTTIITVIMCSPFILCAKEILSIYVGNEYIYLSKWLVLWCITVLIQMHTTPGNALILAYGKTKLLIAITSVSCFISMGINVFLCPFWGVGSAIIGYFVYVCLVIGVHYTFYYRFVIRLNNLTMLKSFVIPSVLGTVSMAIVLFINNTLFLYVQNNVLVFVMKYGIWLILYMLLLLYFNQIDKKRIKYIIKYR